jgi:MFS family permease
VGLTGSAYYGGFIAGCIAIPRLVRRVGHIRVFMVLTAGAACALLAIPLSDNFMAWIVLRGFTGVALSGLYLVIESWLNETVADTQRGAVLSVYTLIVLVASVAGQSLLFMADPDGFEIIIIATLFLCFAAVPVGLSQAPAPVMSASQFSIRSVFRTSRAATGGVFVAGMVSGSFYTLAPVYAINTGNDVSSVAVLMGVGILGGAALQLPLGRLSDRFDRRLVILWTMAAGVGTCLLGALVGGDRYVVTLLVFFLFGAAVMPIYPLCLAHANDKATEGFLETGTGILIINACGAILGPTICALAMTRAGPEAFYLYGGTTLTLGVVWTFGCLRGSKSVRPHYERFTSTPKTTQGVLELDRRYDRHDVIESDE